MTTENPFDSEDDMGLETEPGDKVETVFSVTEPKPHPSIIMAIQEDDVFQDAQKANKMPAEKWVIVKRAAALLEEHHIRYVLMGTAALAAHGIMPHEVPDIDFLVEKHPTGVLEDQAPSDSNSDGESGSYLFPILDGDTKEETGETIKVDFVPVDNPIENGFLVSKACAIDGVRCMTVENALGIKKWKGRKKDLEFVAALAADDAKQLEEAF